MLSAFIVCDRAVEDTTGKIIFVYYRAVECAASCDSAPYISDRSAHRDVRHSERAVILNAHAAVHGRSTIDIGTRFAAGDHAAGDSLVAVFIRHPSAVLIYAELPRSLCFRAVCQRHFRVLARHSEEQAFSGESQHMVVQIQRHRTAYSHVCGNGDVRRQPDSLVCAVRQGGGQLRLRGGLPHGLLGKYHAGQQAQHHAQCEQDTE